MRDVLVTNKRMFAGSIILAAVIFSGFKMHPKPKPPLPVPEPIVVEWEVDSKFGDKVTKLPNGLTLTIYGEGNESDGTWSWSVSGTAPNEHDARNTLFKMGGVK